MQYVCSCVVIWRWHCIFNIKKFGRLSSTSKLSNAARTHKRSAIFWLGEGITEADGTIKSHLSQVLCFLVAWESWAVVKTDSSSETEACNTNVWNDIPGNSFAIATHKCWKTGTKGFIPSGVLSSPELVAMATWIKITSVQQFTCAFVEETDGDPGKVKLF